MDASNLGNQSEVELAWACKAFDDAQLHYNIITALDTSDLCLSKCDELIYIQFRKDFPDFNITNLSEDSLKSPKAKEKWRIFCNYFKTIIEDFNFGTLLRLNAMKDYCESNTVFATKIQFLAVEIARRKEGITAKLYKQALAERITNLKDGIKTQKTFEPVDTKYADDLNKLVENLAFEDKLKK